MRVRKMRALGRGSSRTYEGAGSAWKRVQEPKLATASIWGLKTRGRVRTRVSVTRLIIVFTLLARYGC